MPWDLNLFVIGRFAAYKGADAFGWPKWLSTLELRSDYVGRAEKGEKSHSTKRNLRNGLRLIELPKSLAEEGLVCTEAFRYWYTNPVSNNLFASVLFVFKLGGDQSVDGSRAFASFCQRRIFRRGAVYSGSDNEPVSLVMYSPHKVNIHNQNRYAWSVYARAGAIQAMPHENF